MDVAALRTLEYHKVQMMLAERTSSVMGREIAEKLTPSSDKETVEIWLAETQEAHQILSGLTNVPLGGIRDIRSFLKRAELGAVLEPHELSQVASTLYASRRMKNFFADLAEIAPTLSEMANQITILRKLEEMIEATVNSDGSIRDDASVELARIRRDIKQFQHRVKEKLDGILRSSEYQKYFQDTLITMRGDRYVIPIKLEYRQYFPGIVHDQSASGATVFIEPMAVVNLNNDIKQLMSAEKNEVERILQIISGHIAQAVPEAINNCNMLARLDFSFAKARLGLDWQAVYPVLNDHGYVDLRQARHPLIPSGVVVPIDLHLGKKFKTLLITGPNTGGKTVSLKTLGLFAIMVQAGLYIPASAGSEMPIFTNVFADIGDEQSIEQSLSTFSGHMTHLVDILAKVGSNDLVLVDEIGAGTDPDEGAALAMAILEHLLSAGATTVATTHYSELKTFAYSRPGVQNASVEFNVETLRPTYRLLIGIPGSSNAFAISKRLGLDASIVNRAKQLIDSEHAEFENVLNSLEQEKLQYEKLNSEALDNEREINRIRQKIEQEQEVLERNKGQLLSKAKTEATRILRQAKKEAEEIITELKLQSAVQEGREKQKAMQDARQRLASGLSVLEGDFLQDTEAPQVIDAPVYPGARVYVTTLKQVGTVLAITSKEASVQLGIMKMNVPLSACRLLPEEAAKLAKSNKQHDVTYLAKVSDISREVDIRGITVEEAELVLSKYLDDAILAGLNEVTVIHGKGTGALRTGVRSYLKHHHNVRDISIGEFNAGGNGATVVRLK